MQWVDDVWNGSEGGRFNISCRLFDGSGRQLAYISTSASYDNEYSFFGRLKSKEPDPSVDSDWNIANASIDGDSIGTFRTLSEAKKAIEAIIKQ